MLLYTIGHRIPCMVESALPRWWNHGLPHWTLYSGQLTTPGRMSLTLFVPADVPSLLHSSKPLELVAAEKKSVPLKSVRDDGLEEPALGLMSLIRLASSCAQANCVGVAITAQHRQQALSNARNRTEDRERPRSNLKAIMSIPGTPR